MSAESGNVVQLRKDCPSCQAEHDRAEEFARAVAAQEERIRELEAQNERMEEDNRLLEKELRQKRSLLSRARGVRNARREVSLFADQMDAVWEEWRSKVRPDAREFSADRFEPVEERFKAGHELPAFFEAIEGARAVKDDEIGWKPYNATTYCDLKSIFKSEASMTRFREHAQEARKRRAHALRELRRAFCQFGRSSWDEEAGATGFCANCALAAPTLDEEGKDSTSALTPDGQLVCASGCSHEEQLEALRGWWRDFRRGERGQAA